MAVKRYDPINDASVFDPQPPTTARVVRVDETGVWASPLGEDPRDPVGPCLGSQDLDVDAIVLLVETDHGPWVAATHTGALPPGALLADIQEV